MFSDLSSDFPSVFDTEIHSPPPLKNVSWLQANKSDLLFAILKQANKKLVTLMPTGKTMGLKNSSSGPINPITSGSPKSSPFLELITPEEQRVTQAKDAVREKPWYWSEGRVGQREVCSLRTAV